MSQTPSPASSSPRIAIVSASWHQDIVGQALTAMQDTFQQRGVSPDNVDRFDVPGAFEIPLHAQKLAQTGRYDAIIACAFVVNGGIYRHEFVSAAVIDGLMRVQLDHGVPVLSAVLTPRDFHEHQDHLDFFRAHFVKKGKEVAGACLDTIASLKKLAPLTL